MAKRAAKAARRSMLINKGFVGSQMETDAGNTTFRSFYTRVYAIVAFLHRAAVGLADAVAA